jgi:hypothetical protein
MKKLFTLLAVIICLPFIVKAQRVEIVPFGGYVFPGYMSTDGGEVRFLGNAWYGGMISIAISRVVDIDLLYNRQDTKAEVNSNDYYYYIQSGDVPLSINYMHVGFTKNFRVNPTVSPFIGFNLGACLFAPKEDYSDAWFFSMGMNAGAKVYFGKRFGLRLQAQLLVPAQGAGFTMFVGTGGASSGVSVYSTLIQFGFTGGLIFRLGKIQSTNTTQIQYR